MEYRKKVELRPGTDYWFVDMGELNFLNGGVSYPFTSEEAARKFAVNHKLLAKQKHGVNRRIEIRHPDGFIQEVEL